MKRMLMVFLATEGIQRFNIDWNFETAGHGVDESVSGYHNAKEECRIRLWNPGRLYQYHPVSAFLSSALLLYDCNIDWQI